MISFDMKNVLLCLLMMLTATALRAQDITGEWNGILNVQGTQLTLVFHIQDTDSGYTTSFDSPDQGAMGISFQSTSFTDSTLTLSAPNIGATYRGAVVSDDSVAGTWSQGGVNYPLTLTRDEAVKETLNRPQEPDRPLPYLEEEVRFENLRDSLTLAGTLTLPGGEGPHPAVVLISGSGPQDRNQEVFGHRTFLVLADHLTRQGIAVLRYDDRGTAESTGNYNNATIADFATDVEAAVAFLKSRGEINPRNVGLVGHSEGGAVAPMVAARSGGGVAHIVLLAGTGTPGHEVSRLQARTLTAMEEIPDRDAFVRFAERTVDIASSDGDLDTIRNELRAHYQSADSLLKTIMPPESVPGFVEQQIQLSTRPWARYFYDYNPADELEKVRCPVLSLNGSEDVQVPANVHQAAIREALKRGGNPDYTILELPGLNHMFQECSTCSMAEYPEIEQTFAPEALREISTWIKSHLR